MNPLAYWDSIIIGKITPIIVKGAKKQQLEVMEYLFIEKILQDAPVLRNDEFSVLRIICL